MSENSLGSAMAALDQTFKSFLGRAAASSPLICCLFGHGQPLLFAEPMPREPLPAVGQPIDQNFAEIVREATLLNPAVHDGAIMASIDPNRLCKVTGWSYRLFPPSGASQAPPNRGSAFNSCLAMSSVDGVVSIYLVSGSAGWRFEKGRIQAL